MNPLMIKGIFLIYGVLGSLGTAFLGRGINCMGGPLSGGRLGFRALDPKTLNPKPCRTAFFSLSMVPTGFQKSVFGYLGFALRC